MPSRRLKLFGPFEATLDNIPVSPPNRSCERVLAYLAVFGKSSRREVAAAIWPNATHDRALVSLRQCLLKMRDSEFRDWIESRRFTLNLLPSIETDIPPIDESLFSGDINLQVPNEPLLEGWNDGWAVSQRSKWTSMLGLQSTDQTVSHLPAESIESVRAAITLIQWAKAQSHQEAVELASRCIPLLRLADPQVVVKLLAPSIQRSETKTENCYLVLDLVARCHYLIGELESALVLYRRLSREATERGTPEGILYAGGSSSVILRELGLAAEAVQEGKKILAYAKSYGDTMVAGIATYAIGCAQFQNRDYKQGIENAELGQRSFVDISFEATRLFVGVNLAMMYLDYGDLERAIHHLNYAKSEAKKCGDKMGILEIRMIEQLILLQRGSSSFEKCLHHLNQVMGLCESHRFYHLSARVAERLCAWHRRQGQTVIAQKFLENADRMRRKVGCIRTPHEQSLIEI